MKTPKAILGFIAGSLLLVAGAFAADACPIGSGSCGMKAAAAKCEMCTDDTKCDKCKTADKAKCDKCKAKAKCGMCTADAQCDKCKAADKAKCGKCKTKAKCGKCTADAECDRCKARKSASISTEELKELLVSQTPPLLLDARTGKFDDGQRIPGALSLHAGSSPEEIAKALPSKEALIVTYCANLKCPASSHLTKLLRKQGYKNIREYSQGIQGWISAGGSVDKAE
ncbi:MAG: rhodanese-like domain-containing protein [Planctomycetes bacterium]|nr:rhodanese-like domain-containing protein [Planctomycetota bacterium]